MYITLTAWPSARRTAEEYSHFRSLSVRVPVASSFTPLRTPSCAIGVTRAHRSLQRPVSLSLSLSLSPSLSFAHSLTGGRAINNCQSASPIFTPLSFLPLSNSRADVPVCDKQVTEIITPPHVTVFTTVATDRHGADAKQGF